MQTISNCRVCKSKKIKPFFDLGQQPLANSLLKSPKQEEKFYPLSLSWCTKCGLVQLNQTVEPKELFSNYVWVTGTSKTARDFSETFCKEVLARTKYKKGDFVLEVGSNDGTFLLPFIKRGFEVLGIDPAKNIAKLANKDGIPTRALFFSQKVARAILKEKGQAKIIIARNVVYHVADTRGFVEGLSICLAQDGVLVIEVHYGGKILEELHYDSIYHEHLCYFTLKTLERLLKDFHLYIFDIGVSPINRSGLIVYARKKRVESKKANAFKLKEKKDKINEFKTWSDFAKRAYKHKEKMLSILKDAKKKGVIVGYGASARSSTLLNFCGIDSKTIALVADDNPIKQGLFTAGSHILIDSAEKVMKQEPPFVLMLAWNFADEIMTKLRQKFGFKGTFIIPLPNEPFLKKV